MKIQAHAVSENENVFSYLTMKCGVHRQRKTSSEKWATP